MSGIYIHVPFCRKKCVYCDFYFSTRFEGYRKPLIQTVAQEITHRKSEIEQDVLSLYFGGGTPSVLNESEFAVLFEALASVCNLQKIEESTIEINPEDISASNLELWKTFGFNRLSIGLQSLSESQLSWMNRGHGVNQVWKGIDLALNFGFQNISLDLIYGLPNMTASAWEEQITAIAHLPIKHLSAYCLTVEEKTELKRQLATQKITLPKEELVIEQYEIMCSILKKADFEHYEISSFCKPGFHSLHNSSYWNKTSYLGFGPSAHSFQKNTRRWNVSNNKKYMDLAPLENNWFETEKLTLQDQWNELFLTGFRSKKGVLKSDIERFGGFSNQEQRLLNSKKQTKMVEENEISYTLNETSWLFADGLASEFFRLNP